MIQANNIRFGYNRQENIIDDVSLHIEAGRICGLFGPNGSGKTTLLKLISGLDKLEGGELNALQENPWKRKASWLSKIYYLPTEIALLVPNLQAMEQLIAPFYPTFDPSILNEAIQLFELDKQKDLVHFSYGQRKKVLLAFAIATQVPLLLLDEPTNGLDINAKEIFRKLLVKYSFPEQTSLITTHHNTDIASVLDDLIIMQHGRIVLHASIDHLSQNLQTISSHREPKEGEALSWKRVPGGYQWLQIGSSNLGSTLDFDLLYNASLKGSLPARLSFSNPTMTIS